MQKQMPKVQANQNIPPHRSRGPPQALAGSYVWKGCFYGDSFIQCPAAIASGHQGTGPLMLMLKGCLKLHCAGILFVLKLHFGPRHKMRKPLWSSGGPFYKKSNAFSAIH
nr:hypothetical protein CFP56_27889 [Quercus suber]